MPDSLTWDWGDVNFHDTRLASVVGNLGVSVGDVTIVMNNLTAAVNNVAETFEGGTMNYDDLIDSFYEWWVDTMWGVSRNDELNGNIDALQRARFEDSVVAWLDSKSDTELASLSGKKIDFVEYASTIFTVGESRDGYYIPVGVERTRTERLSFGEMIAELRKVSPKWLNVRVVKGAVRFSTDRGGMYQGIVETIPKIRVSGKGADRYISDRIFTRALRDLGNVRSQLLSQLRGDMKARMNVDTRITKPVRSGKGNIDAFVSKLSSTRYSAEKIIPLFDAPGHGFKSSRSWGIEVEVAGALGVVRQPGWQSKGDGSLWSAYEKHLENHTSRTWEPDTCAVCAIAKPASDNGDSPTREFVSPILSSFHSRGLEAMIEQINTQPQNESAGVHVHVGVDDLTVKQIGSLVYGYSVIEPLIESSYERETREYCRIRDPRELVRIGQSVKELMRSNQPFDRDSIYQGDRYVSLNLCAIEAHGTVEFRAMGPVYNYDTLIRWAYFCREMVNVAKTGVSFSEWNSIDSFDKLKSLFIRKGRESVDILMESIDSDSIKDSLKRNQNSFNSIDWPELAVIGGEI